MADTIGLGSGWSLKKEATYGVAETTGFRSIPFLQESLEIDRKLIDSVTLKGGNYLQTSDSWRQSVRAGAGDVQSLLFDSGAALLWEAMLGSVSTTGAGPYTHTFTIAKNLPSYTMQIGLGGVTASDLRKQVTGAKVDSWEVKLAVEQNATLGLTWVYSDQTLTVAATSGTVPAGMKAFTFLDGAFSGAGALTGNIQAISFKGENNLKKDQFSMGSQVLAEPVRNGRMRITGEMETTVDGTVTNYNKWTAGTELALVLTLTLGTKTCTITTNVRIEGTSPTVDGEEKLMTTVPFSVLAPTTDASGFTVAVVNSDSTP